MLQTKPRPSHPVLWPDDRRLRGLRGGKAAGRRAFGGAAGEAAREEGAFVWIGVAEPGEEEFQAVAAEFGLHELAVEDAVRAHQRPKVEAYGETLHVVVKTARYVDPDEVIQIGEISSSSPPGS